MEGNPNGMAPANAFDRVSSCNTFKDKLSWVGTSWYLPSLSLSLSTLFLSRCCATWTVKLESKRVNRNNLGWKPEGNYYLDEVIVLVSARRRKSPDQKNVGEQSQSNWRNTTQMFQIVSFWLILSYSPVCLSAILMVYASKGTRADRPRWLNAETWMKSLTPDSKLPTRKCG